MSNDYFYQNTVKARVERLQAESIALQSQYERARAEGDTDGAADALEGLAAIDNRFAEMNTAVQRAQQPPQTIEDLPEKQQQRIAENYLTPAQREAAKVSGVDAVTYCKNLAKLQALKVNGNYPDGQH